MCSICQPSPHLNCLLYVIAMAEVLCAHSGLDGGLPFTECWFPTRSPLMLTVCFLSKPVSGVTNKDCTEAVCLYSSQCKYLYRGYCLVELRRYWSQSWLPPHHQPSPALQSRTPSFLNRSSGSKAHP